MASFTSVLGDIGLGSYQLGEIGGSGFPTLFSNPVAEVTGMYGAVMPRAVMSIKMPVALLLSVTRIEAAGDNEPLQDSTRLNY